MTAKYNGIFKTYDIRSLDHDPMDETLCYSIGRGVAGYMQSQGRSDQAVLISCDGRLSNTDFMIAFVAGLQDAGHEWFVTSNKLAESVDGQSHPFGVCCSSFFYYCAAKLYNFSIQFTASHNPPERVGAKACDITGSLYPTSDLQAMITEYIDYPYLGTERHETVRQQIIDDVTLESPWLAKKISSYQTLLSEAFATITKPLTIVVDYSGGAAVSREQDFLQHTIQTSGAPLTIIPLNSKIDGTFACHLSDTSSPQNYEQLGHTVRDHSADMGVMFDGDADRIGVVDQHGEYVQGGNIVALIAQGALIAHPESAVVGDITCTDAVRDTIIAGGGQHIVSRVGYRFVKELAIRHDASFGGELSCHFLFPESYYAESPLLALAYMLRTLESYESVTDAVTKLNPYITPPLRNYTVSDKDTILEKIITTYSDYQIDTTDGVKVRGDDWWFLVRKSGTEPLIRYYVEAKSADQIDTITRDIEDIIRYYQ